MLNIKIFSFSYKKSGIPKDETGNGGGFVFDCRFIYNPGREPAFIELTGKDKAVIEFLDNDSIMKQFMNNAFLIIQSAIDNYIERDFTGLMVSFGCTGGQHRSVYAAEKLRAMLSGRYGSKINLRVSHKEFPGLDQN